jgi:hypothetical protein
MLIAGFRWMGYLAILFGCFLSLSDLTLASPEVA